MTRDICAIEGCGRPRHARGLCDPHYLRWSKNGDPDAGRPIGGRRPDAVCSVENCDRKGYARGWCRMHYARWQRNGDAQTAQTIRDHVSVCTVDGCDSGGKLVHGMCNKHYHRWRTHGDTSVVHVPKRPLAEGLCSVSGCGEPNRTRGFCRTHYLRWRRYGDPEIVRPRGGVRGRVKTYAPELVERIRELYCDRGMTLEEVAAEIGVDHGTVRNIMIRHEIPRRRQVRRRQTGPDNPLWRGDAVGYTALHRRVDARRGQPSKCERCGTDDPSVRYEWANLTGDYTNIDDFERMCALCHRRFDAARRKETGERTRPLTRHL